MITTLLMAAAVAATTAPPMLSNADQYCAFQYGWQLATHNPLGNQESFEACLRHPPHRTTQDGSADDVPLFPPSTDIPSEQKY